MSAGAVERALAHDSAALIDCAARHAATVQFYRDIEKALAGK